MKGTKQTNKIIKALLGGWKYTLCHRYELLGNLNNKDLDFTPRGSKKFKNLQYQFACIGSTQQAYTKMLKEGHFCSRYFCIFKPGLIKLREIKKLADKLGEIDKEFKEEILKHSDKDEFEWGNIKTPVWRIITLLQEHERLHHGQLISYFTSANLEFPLEFKKAWHL